MNIKDICAKCCGLETGVKRPTKKHHRHESGKHEFCASAFLPECVRNALQEVRSHDADMLPFSVRFSVVLLSCETPAIPEVIDLYSISNNFSIVDVVDELNIHVTGIIKRLVAEGGDIIHLEDGLMECIWPVDSDDIGTLCYAILDAALAVQKEFGATPTKIGNDLRNKIGIAIGELDILFVGSERVYYTAVGDVLMESRKAMKFCNWKEVMVTTSFWDKIQSKLLYQWRKLDEDLVTVYQGIEQPKAMDENVEDAKYNLLKIYESERGEELIKYLHPLPKSARTKQQLQILTSMSQVVFLAVRAIDLDVFSVDLLHKATNALLEIVEEFDGILAKIMYQSDLTFCIIFGFPGFKHRDDAVRSLLCAQKILNALKGFNMKISIGVSSGMVFCGILGPSFRQECCVLGMSVRIALNLVEQFSDLELVCCINTFFRTCRTLGEIFTPIRKRLKGVKTTNLFFKIDSEESKKESRTVICVARKHEKEMISNALKELKDGLNDLEKILPFITITGKLGNGKTILLSWALQEGKKLGYRLTARASNTVFEEPYGNAWSILKQILSSQLMDNESKILEMLGPNASQRFPLHLLNRRMNMSFLQPAVALGEENSRDLMVELVKQCSRGEPVLIGLDNAQHTGIESWMFLQCLLLERCACVVATFTEEFSSNVPFVRHLMAQQYLSVELGPILGEELGALACHVLHVDAIHRGFLEFLQEQSQGNALHLQEILMLPPLQKHFCLVPYASVTESTLEENFIQAERDSPIDHTTAKVCDILDQEGLWSIKIPKHLLDIVKDHTTGLNPEEQMLMRKCSLLGDSFGLRILEAVCPEYTLEEIYQKLQNLVQKNILTLPCDHWKIVTDSTDQRRITLGDVPLEYCIHPVVFVSEFLKTCVLHSMAGTQRDRFHLYLADLLWDEIYRSCDACRREERELKMSSSRMDFLQQYKIPTVDFRLCTCLHLKTDILMQVEYHTEKGHAPVRRQLKVLLEAAETGLNAWEVSKVEAILNKANRLNASSGIDETHPDYYLSIAIERLRARMKLDLGKPEDALRCLKRTMLMMNVVFPMDVKKGLYKSKRYQGFLGEEECKCLALGISLLTILGDYDNAFAVAQLHLNAILQENVPICGVIEARTLLLGALIKTDPGNRREKMSRKLVNQIRQQCFKRLSEPPVVKILELKIIVRTFKSLVRYLFESAQLDEGKELGRKSFQLLKLINHPKELTRLLFMLANIYFYGQCYEKCLEMLNQLQDAYQQSGDPMSEVIYHTMLLKVVTEPGMADGHHDQVKICEDFAKRKNIAVSFHPRQNDRIFCLSAAMALWCFDRKIEVTFPLWYDQALWLQRDLHLNNYWTISGTIYLVILEISKMKEKFFIFTNEELDDFKRKTNKSIDNISRQVKSYVPVLDRDVKNLEKYLQKALKECKVLKD